MGSQLNMVVGSCCAYSYYGADTDTYHAGTRRRQEVGGRINPHDLQSPQECTRTVREACVYVGLHVDLPSRLESAQAKH